MMKSMWGQSQRTYDNEYDEDDEGLTIYTQQPDDKHTT